jgi:hypothetical protein
VDHPVTKSLAELPWEFLATLRKVSHMRLRQPGSTLLGLRG